jgi:pyrroline-5-carboxylate reductase
MENRIISIGGGNMGSAILGGLLAKGYPKELITVVDPNPQVQQDMAASYGVTVLPKCTEIGRNDIVLLAVKPQIMQHVATQLADLVPNPEPLFISIAAGITTAQLGRWLAQSGSIVRVMPNTPALVGNGAAALFATPNTSAAERTAAESIIGGVGIAEWVDDEALLDVVTALSGSGPAYFFLFIEIMEKIAVELGLEQAVARKLAIETAHGSALLARQSSDSPGVLRERVTSPGGTTERALDILREGNIEGLLRDALTGAYERSSELAASAEQKS